jgi:hypothetical protein
MLSIEQCIPRSLLRPSAHDRVLISSKASKSVGAMLKAIIVDEDIRKYLGGRKAPDE